MTEFTLHYAETAPENAKPVLRALADRYGFVPNMMAAMAEAPVDDAYGKFAWEWRKLD
jgi:hypothetical protein